MWFRGCIARLTLACAVVGFVGIARADVFSDALQVTLPGQAPTVKELTEEMEQHRHLILAFVFRAPTGEYCIHTTMCGQIDSKLLNLQDVGSNGPSDTMGAFILPENGVDLISIFFVSDNVSDGNDLGERLDATLSLFEKFPTGFDVFVESGCPTGCTSTPEPPTALFVASGLALFALKAPIIAALTAATAFAGRLVQGRRRMKSRGAS